MQAQKLNGKGEVTGTVDITPAAFNPNNPNAPANLSKLQQAEKELIEIEKRKAAFAEELVQNLTSDGNTLATAIFSAINLRQRPLTQSEREDMAGFQEMEAQWKQLDDAHRAATEKVIEAFRGV